MTEFSGPFDGDPIATYAQHRSRNRWPDGIDADHGSTDFQVTAAGDGLSANIAAGNNARIQGSMYTTDATVNVASNANGGGSGRPDRLVLRNDGTQITPVVLEGTPGGSVPSLTQSDTGTWELPLARWVRAAGGGITSVVDERIFLTQSGDLVLSDSAIGGGVTLSNLIRSAGRRKGQMVKLYPSGERFEWNGSTWTRHAKAGSWETVVNGSIINAATDFPIPANRYSMVRVYLRGHLDGIGFVSMRINNDATDGLHRRGTIVHNLETGAVEEAGATDSSVWYLAKWSGVFGCSAYATIYSTHIHANLSFDGGGNRPSNTESARHRSLTGGDLSSARTLSSLRFSSSLAAISTIRVWIEGLIA